MVDLAESDVMRRYVWRAKKWTKYATGGSLHNIPQGIGRAYSPVGVEGYFNDLTGKTKWSGPCDEAGIPVVTTDRGNRFSFPITVFQKGLGHWDLWLLSGRTDLKERDAFIGIADWATNTIDAAGGWPCWRLLNRGTTTPYSSMAQGQGISVLVRAHVATGNTTYRETAILAAQSLIDPVSEMGVAFRDADGLWMEEYPGARMRGVLNGWIFSLMGLHDLLLTGRDTRIQHALNETLETISMALPRYDRGYWSMYDLGGTIASPFYHRLHIAQLRALASTFRDHAKVFNGVAERWTALDRNVVARTRAILVKVAQKIRDTGNEEFT